MKKSSAAHRKQTASSSVWEARYQAKDMPWEKGEASPGLVDFLAAHPQLPRGKVCVPGCGSGHDVRAWAKAGFEAFGFDLGRICKYELCVHDAFHNF